MRKLIMDKYELGRLAGLDEALKAIQEAGSQIEQPKELDGMVHQAKVLNACIDAINKRREKVKGYG
jgi:hypothetical protein